MKRYLSLALCCLFAIGSAASAAEYSKVEFFSPQGTAKNIRQVKARFNQPMVSFGDPRTDDMPFEVFCRVSGKGRWADTRNWIYDFDKELPGGLRAEFRLKSELKSLSGKRVSGQKIFRFSTGGPVVVSSFPYEGSRHIDEEQVFILSLDAEPTEESVLKCASFEIEGIANPVGIRIIKGEEREFILKSQYRRGSRPEENLVLIQCIQRFPAEANVRLIWGKGVTSRESMISTDRDMPLSFTTRPRFKAQFQCAKENPGSGCSPLSPMNLVFSAPISREQARDIVLTDEDGTKWNNREDESSWDSEENVLSQISFKPPFPEKSAFRILLPADLKDEAGRTLVNADVFPLSVRTGGYPPLAKFNARFGILEYNGERLLPVTIRNLEPEIKGSSIRVAGGDGIVAQVTARTLNVGRGNASGIQSALRRAAQASRESSMLAGVGELKEFKVPKPGGTSALEVVGIPFEEPGLYLVELESTILGKALLGKPKPMYVPAAVLVTDLSVHFKWGRESSLVWVTSLGTGEPVTGAKITVFDCKEKVLWKGNTNGSGMAIIRETLTLPSDQPECRYRPDSRDYPQMGALSGLQQGVFIVAQASNDMAFVHSSWNNGIEPFRFNLPTDLHQEAIIAHTVFDRTLLRAGDTLHMKHVLRVHTMEGISFSSASKKLDTLLITHFGSLQRYELPLEWNAGGIAENEWAIPVEAKLGTYEVSLARKKASSPQRVAAQLRHEESVSSHDELPETIPSGTFRVEEFRVPLMKAFIKGPAEPVINPEKISLDLGVNYLAGGPAGNLSVKLRSHIRQRFLDTPEGFEGFIFSNGIVKEGLQKGSEGWESEEASQDDSGKSFLKVSDTRLDPSGAARVLITDLPKINAPKELLSEIEYRDPNGEIQTASSRIPLWNSSILIGLMPESWAMSKDKLRFQIAALDLKGKPVDGVAVKVDLLEKKYFSHRKRIVGGFYSYDHTQEVKRVCTLYEGKTGPEGLIYCESRSPVSGNVIIQVEAADNKGNKTFANTEMWIAGKSRWWFEMTDNDRMDLIPMKRRYEPGENAAFQVRMPFREANALVTVEREGVIEGWVTRLAGEKPVIEIPIKGSYAPNVFVSVLAVRGRLGDIQPTAMVDLGRPAYRLGIAEIMVGWKEHELKVAVSPERHIYRVRENARVRFTVRTMDDRAPPPGSELAVAAVDEGLLELSGNKSWDILSAMMGRRGYEVETATAQMQVIGRRHYGKKALPAGGGGGRQMTRELFDTLLIWKGRLPLDKEGEAVLDIPLNDSITGFRIAAVAVGGEGLFGKGSASIRSSQEIMIFSGLPPVVREGDEFRGEFTVRNATENDTEAEISAVTDPAAAAFNARLVRLKAGESKKIGWDIKVPPGVPALTWDVRVAEKGTVNADHMRVKQKVIPVVSSRVFQATISQLDNEIKLGVEMPRDAIPNQGGVRVGLKPRMVQNIEGIVEYMARYPYGCMEQRISTAVALRDARLWSGLMAKISAYLDPEGLVKYFPSMRNGSPVLTAYLVAIAQEADWKIPADIQANMESALKRFVEGSIKRTSAIPAVDLSITKLMALEALSRVGKMEPRLLGTIAIEPGLWPTSALIDWFNILMREKGISGRESRLKETERILRSRLNLHGTGMSFTTEESDRLWWLMVSNDLNAVRLVLSVTGLASWKNDVVRLVNGALGRQRGGRWDLTLANAWGVLAMEKFSRIFEAENVDGVSRASLRDRTGNIEWDKSPEGASVLFPWPDSKEELQISHSGAGRPWVMVQSLAAIPLKRPVSSGFRLVKSFLPVEKKNPDCWSTGDLALIRLEIEAFSDWTWVAVSDPIPAGASILGSGLAGDSQLLSEVQGRSDYVRPTFEERSFEAFKAYYEYLPKGKRTLEYTVRINHSGLFHLPSTRVEALYFPEMMAEVPGQVFRVGP
ncbi:MAG: alpha-2-macroglobulin [Desulfobacteraceae bacterium]|nr:MAG: alpha-2-macroglobulin [Desulfobacteraceae bacterium]